MFLKKIYQKARNLVFSHWWLPTKEQMRQISSHYNYRVEFPHRIERRVVVCQIRIFGFKKDILATDEAIGVCYSKEKLMVISDFDHRVFWHELGHALTSNYFGKSLIASIPFFGWVINETIATLMGYKLNSYWKRLI